MRVLIDGKNFNMNFNCNGVAKITKNQQRKIGGFRGYCKKVIVKNGFVVLKSAIDKIELTRINNCVNGNPRYVMNWVEISNKNYNEAINLAKSIGGKKYHTKNYGGGIVFQSYNTAELVASVLIIKTENA